jgi:Uncharacterized enzymes related to aldose 1-epimerase
MNPITGRGGLPFVRLESPWSAAEIYLQGACVTHFQLHSEPPVLFLSEKSRFEKNAAIRGGIPIIFPWFGKPSGRPTQHGFARVREWEFVGANRQPDGKVTAHFRLPASAELMPIPVEYFVTIGTALSAELVVTNYSSDVFSFENCLHTYFSVSDIERVRVTGLQGVAYLDAVDQNMRKMEMAEAIEFSEEVDRIYLDTPHVVDIHDTGLSRVIRIEKENAASTVVWNPWVAKARMMADFGDDEYRRMVCVESGNVATNQLQLMPGQEARLKLNISTGQLR